MCRARGQRAFKSFLGDLWTKVCSSCPSSLRWVFDGNADLLWVETSASSVALKFTGKVRACQYWCHPLSACESDVWESHGRLSDWLPAGSNQNAATLKHWPPQALTKSQFISESPRGIQGGDDRCKVRRRQKKNAYAGIYSPFVIKWHWGGSSLGGKVPLPTWWLISVLTLGSLDTDLQSDHRIISFGFWSGSVHRMTNKLLSSLKAASFSSEHKIGGTYNELDFNL